MSAAEAPGGGDFWESRVWRGGGGGDISSGWADVLGTLLGNHRIERQLGEGGMGVVYVGRHEPLGHQVVVKVLRAEMSRKSGMVQRFFNEAQAATAINHPGIVQVFDFGTTPDGRAFIVMELLEGQTLTARMKQRRLEAVACCRLARQIANALQVAHERGIVHRDLKPDNLFLVPDAEVSGGERVKVLDFGIAKLAGELHEAGVKTRTDVVMGTPSYMSPEQCRSAVSAEPRSDIYSLGCILFEMACGRRPFAARGLVDVVAAHLHDPPPPPRGLAPDLPPELARLIVHLLAKQPSARPQTMAAVSEALDEILRELAGGAPRAQVRFSDLEPTLPYPPLPPHSTQAPPTTQPLPTTRPLPTTQAPGPTPSASTVPFVRALAPAPALPQALPQGANPAVLLPPECAPVSLPAVANHPPVRKLSSSSTTLSGSAGMLAIGRRIGRFRLPVVVGSAAVAVVLTTITIALAVGAPAAQKSQISYDEIVAAPPHEDAAVLEDAAATPVISLDSSEGASGAAEPAPPANAEEIEVECLGYEADRKWDELEQCAVRLEPLDPKRAAELKTRAVEEAKTKPRIDAFETALRQKNLRQAKTELDQIWQGSVEYSNMKQKYEQAEARAIHELAADLARVKSPDCAEYKKLLVKERALNPNRVIQEATRRSPCSPAAKCDANKLAQQAYAWFSANQAASAFPFYEEAYACNPTPDRASHAFVVSCILENMAKAKWYWKRMSNQARSQALSSCARRGITEPMLNAP